jgi:prepilin-type N-terminal cleavage/methylation domain-containing protein
MKGFTLIETLVTISITLVLSGLAIAYNRSSERQIVIYKDQATVIGILNRARSLTAQKYRDPSNPSHITCAFGLHIEPDSRNFVLFQDLGEGGCGPGAANYRYDSGASPSEALETFSLDPRLRFDGVPISGLDIFFIPPDITASSSTDLPVAFTIGTNDGQFAVTTTVAAGGQIVTE